MKREGNRGNSGVEVTQISLVTIWTAAPNRDEAARRATRRLGVRRVVVGALRFESFDEEINEKRSKDVPSEILPCCSLPRIRFIAIFST